MRRLVVVAAAIAAPSWACGHHDRAAKRDAAGRVAADAADAAAPADALPPAPPVPLPPLGLPALPSSAALAAITPDQLALGELLFWDGRLASDGKTSCASCHDPMKGFSGAIDRTAAGEPNRRRTPSLENLAWVSEYGWNGRFTTLDDLMHAHVKAQLGQDTIDSAMTRLAVVYAEYIARIRGAPGDAALHSLEAYALTRYAGDSPWDRMERGGATGMDVDAAKQGKPTDPIIAGYVLFTGKAQCAVCHTPPLYTDLRYHRILPPTTDDGRGSIDPRLANAFRTPSLRGLASHAAFLHDGRATSIDQAIDAHVAGSDSDPALAKVALSPAERASLVAFVRALTATKAPPAKPNLP
ncbi:MAG TPA: cytochrome c peroxidase [Kofleriaceae bacterium]